MGMSKTNLGLRTYRRDYRGNLLVAAAILANTYGHHEKEGI